MVPFDSSIRKNEKYVEGRKILEKITPEIIVGPKSNSEEIWIDGIEHLRTLTANGELNEINKDIFIQNHSSVPYDIYKTCLVPDGTDELQEYLVGNFWHYNFFSFAYSYCL